MADKRSCDTAGAVQRHPPVSANLRASPFSLSVAVAVAVAAAAAAAAAAIGATCVASRVPREEASRKGIVRELVKSRKAGTARAIVARVLPLLTPR